MKSIVMPKNEQLTEEMNEQLLKDVKDKKAAEAAIVNDNKKTFTAVDMWNRQRQGRTTRTMMRPWEMN